MYLIFFIYSSVNGHLGCFHVLAIVKNVAMNIGVHVSLPNFVYAPTSKVIDIYSQDQALIMKIRKNTMLAIT